MASDNLHFTKYAYALYGNALADFLRDVVFPGARPAPEEIDIMEPEKIPVEEEGTTSITDSIEKPTVEEGNAPTIEGDNDSVIEEVTP
jgi:hypothetical protein